MHGCCWLVAALFCWLATVWGQQDDSLRGALEAISRRQRDLADPSYYIDRGLSRLHVRPEEELQFYESRNGFQEDGQPEDIGYGYQKSVVPHTAGIFEPLALPVSELGSHDSFGNMHFTEKDLERLAADFPASNIDNNHFAYKFSRNRLPSNSKRSIFRERGDSSPEALQHLYSKHDSDADNRNPALTSSSSFRERFPGRTGLSSSALALVRSFGGLDRDSETGPADDDSDEYLTVLNSIWEKYKNNAPDVADPEELTESDVEELLRTFGNKNDKKRYDSYSNGYDIFNSPLTWTKRTKQNLESPSTSDGFFHALKFLSRDRDVLESLHDEDIPNEDEDEDVARLLLRQQQQQQLQQPDFNAQQFQYERNGYRQQAMHDASLSPHYNRISKRFPITKRSSSNFDFHGKHDKSLAHEHNQRWKKNVGDGDITDPKVAQEINNIFSTSENENREKKSNESKSYELDHTNETKSQENEKLVSSKPDTEDDTSEKENIKEHNGHHMHRRNKESGQIEESGENSFTKPLDVKKKSIDWSNYFGIDRRRKKSDKNFNDEWLLNQYLKAYSISNNEQAHPNDLNQFIRAQQYDSLVNTDDYEVQKKGPDDIDNKLKAMEDIIVDEALKYTGAHEGITDSKEIQKVKDQVMTKLAAAYSLEKMRRALGEFKSSMEAQKESLKSQNSTPKPDEKDEQKDIRVAVKKEKAELSEKEKKSVKKSHNDHHNDNDDDNEVNYKPKPAHSFETNNYMQHYQDDESCPVLEDVAGRCRQISIIAGDRGDLFLPLCTFYQICYFCGPELGTAYPGSCDITFLTEANTLCHDNAQCRFAARRMLAGMRALKGDLSPAGCDWVNNPCLSRFLGLANDR